MGGSFGLTQQNIESIVFESITGVAGKACGNGTLICLKQQQQDGLALKWTSEEMQHDPKIWTLAAVQKEAKAWKEAPEELKRDKEFMIRVMKANGMALEHIGEEMKCDVAIVAAAVQSWRRNG